MSFGAMETKKQAKLRRRRRSQSSLQFLFPTAEERQVQKEQTATNIIYVALELAE